MWVTHARENGHKYARVHTHRGTQTQVTHNNLNIANIADSKSNA